MSDRDASDGILDALRIARAAGQKVAIAGMGSKSFLTRPLDGDAEGRLLSTVEHRGIVDYHPDELVITVRSGTPLKALRQALAREGQMLGFEPPELQGLGTAGGAVASGLAGPGRPWRGGVRDSVLGVVLVNGLGERLRFGGQVMKNVAGFDVSRLQAGAFGIFGVLLEISLRVLPVPNMEQTRVLALEPAEALATMRRWAAWPLPLSATAYEGGRLHVRLSGAESAVVAAARQIGGEPLADEGYWSALRDLSAPFFRNRRLGRRQCAPASPLLASDELIEWGGARRWSTLDDAQPPPGVVPFGAGYARHLCHGAGGDPVLAAYQRRLKAAFDPDNLINTEICDADITA